MSNENNNEGRDLLSCGIETLFAALKQDPEKIYDYLIVGSGYGGSVAADHLSANNNKENPIKVCVLERGREFLPGAFPNSMDEAPSEIRLVTPNAQQVQGNAEGLYDLRLGDDLNILQANGLGGGSLINAGVMERPDPNIFDARRWGGVENLHENLASAYQQVEEKLGAVIDGQKNNILSHKKVQPKSGLKNSTTILKKFESIKTLQEESTAATFKPPSLSISMSKADNSVGQPINQCTLCGNCVSGCNFGAKNSLDENLLLRAKRQGTEIYTGATVLSFSRVPNNEESYWCLKVVFTDTTLRSRQNEKHYEVRTKNLIVSAGSLGSTELMMRSESSEVQFSERLGEQFSSNGDMIFVGFNQNQEANAIAQDVVPIEGKEIGPCITGMIEYKDAKIAKIPLVFQEMAVPASLKFVFQELYTTTNSIRGITQLDLSTHHPGQVDPAQINQNALSDTSLYAAMGADKAQGRLELANHAEYCVGSIQVKWKSLRNSPLLHAQEKALNQMARASGLGGDIIPNPIWKLMPDNLMFLLNNRKGAPLTVHPLGGCPLGENVKRGVCDEYGRVFDAKQSNPNSFHPGLYVLDGALIPRALGINPALTIAALTQRAVEKISKLDTPQVNTDTKSSPRQFLRTPENLPRIKTQIELTERLTGFTTLPSDTGEARDVVIELTIWTKEKSIDDLLYNPNTKSNTDLELHQFEIDTQNTHPDTEYPSNLIRIYYKEDWQALRDQDPRIEMSEQKLTAIAQYEGRISGVISLLECRKTWGVSRLIRGLLAWFPNRGLRDMYQWLFPKPWEKQTQSAPLNWRTMASFGHAGAERVLRYQINVDQTLKKTDFADLGFTDTFSAEHRNLESDGAYQIVGEKNLCYRRASNPWKQLSTVRLRKFPSKRQIRRSNFERIRSYLFSKALYFSQALALRWRQKRFLSFFSITFLLLSPLAVALLIYQRSSGAVFAVVLTIFCATIARVKYNSRRHRDKHNYGKIWLNLDTNYLAKIGIPLINIKQQQNQVQALSDIASLTSYLARIIFGIHFYSFRKPDDSPPRSIDRQPSLVPGLPSAKIYRLNVGEIPETRVPELPAGTAVHIELTRYAQLTNARHRRPILLIHGYSSSSTSFAHKSLPNSLAKHFFDEGRDVWLLDMRTSAALASARHPWRFEDAAEVDIPLAIEYIHQRSADKKIDVLAHCMGGAMLGMAILQDSNQTTAANGQYRKPEYATASFYQDRINRIAFSQATPTPRFTPDNNFRAFLTSHLKELIPTDYQFLPGPNEPISSGLLDRLLYTLPYPIKDYYRTNPRGFSKRKLRASFALTRHRMDALYGQTFEATNLNRETLKHINDIFGPLHIETVLQAGYFATKGVITDAKGQNIYVSKTKLKQRWSKIPTFSLHSKHNGLIDYSTGQRTQGIFREADVDYSSLVIEQQRYGHQDSLLSDHAHVDIFPHFSRFLNTENVTTPEDNKPRISESKRKQTWIIEPPHFGPVIVGQDQCSNRSGLKVLFGLSSARAAKPDFYAFIPVVKRKLHFELDFNENYSLSEYLQDTSNLNPSPVCEFDEVDWLNCIVDEETLSLIEKVRCMRESKESSEQSFLILCAYLDLASMSDDTISIEHELNTGNDGSTRVVVETKPNKHSGERKKTSTITANNISYEIDPSQVLECFFEADANQTHIFQQGLLSQSVLQKAATVSPNARSQKTSALEHQGLAFAIGSCQYPAGIFDSTIAFNSYRDLAHHLTRCGRFDKPDFLALIGDQIYADATAGILDSGDDFDRYTSQYLKLYSDKHVRDVLRQLPVYAMLDDHEIHDNYQPGSEEPDTVNEGIRTFLSFQRGESYADLIQASQSQKPEDYQFWYTFERNGYSFFMLDTRTQRSAREFDNLQSEKVNILGEAQFLALEQWLEKQANSELPKFILSASMLLPRHRMKHGGGDNTLIRSDSWDGYPRSLQRILGLIHDLKVNNLVFLSGDEHMNCYSKIVLQKTAAQEPKTQSDDTNKIIIRSVHCSGLYTPFPFANSRREELMGGLDSEHGEDSFNFTYTAKDSSNSALVCQTVSCFDFDDIDFDDDSPIEVNVCIRKDQAAGAYADRNGFTIISVKP